MHFFKQINVHLCLLYFFYYNEFNSLCSMLPIHTLKTYMKLMLIDSKLQYSVISASTCVSMALVYTSTSFMLKSMLSVHIWSKKNLWHRRHRLCCVIFMTFLKRFEVTSSYVRVPIYYSLITLLSAQGWSHFKSDFN